MPPYNKINPSDLESGLSPDLVGLYKNTHAAVTQLGNLTAVLGNDATVKDVFQHWGEQLTEHINVQELKKSIFYLARLQLSDIISLEADKTSPITRLANHDINHATNSAIQLIQFLGMLTSEDNQISTTGDDIINILSGHSSLLNKRLTTIVQNIKSLFNLYNQLYQVGQDEDISLAGFGFTFPHHEGAIVAPEDKLVKVGLDLYLTLHTLALNALSAVSEYSPDGEFGNVEIKHDVAMGANLTTSETQVDQVGDLDEHKRYAYLDIVNYTSGSAASSLSRVFQEYKEDLTDTNPNSRVAQRGLKIAMSMCIRPDLKQLDMKSIILYIKEEPSGRAKVTLRIVY